MTSLQDTFGRPLRNLRLSVTDRCNLRCAYCMPEEEYAWLKSDDVLSFEELSTVVDAFVSLGVNKVRLTGGEPLVRRELSALVSLLSHKHLDDLALTTNGVLLADQAAALKAAGLHRLTVSLDTLDPGVFQRLTRRALHHQVLEGIAAAHAVSFPQGLKLDVVVMRGVNEHELPAMLAFGRRFNAEVRFIEYMDVGGATHWSLDRVVSRADMLKLIASNVGAVTPLPERGSAPAERFSLPDGSVFGVIASTTQPFCGACDRSRLTADGTYFTCLYATQGVDLRTSLRAGDAAALRERIRATWARRDDRGAESRLRLRASRGPLRTAAELKTTPHLEMHTRGG